MKKILVLAVLLLFLVACGGGSEEDVAYEEDTGYQGNVGNFAAEDTIMEEPSAEEPVEDSAGEPGSSDTSHDAASPAAQRRIVIMQGNMVVETYDPVEIVGFITQLAERYRGFVVDSKLDKTLSSTGDQKIKGKITIRVPAEHLTAAIAEIEAQKLEVIQKDLSGKDVTSEYVDLKSQLRNLEDAATQLKQIMENAIDIEGVLKVYEELKSVNEEAEVIRGQIQYYDEASAMSSLAVDVRQIIDIPEPTPTPTPEPTATPEPWKIGPTFERSSNRLKRSLQDWAEGLVYFSIYSLPTFILQIGPWLVILFFIGRWGYRKYIKNRSVAPTDKAATNKSE